MNPEQKQLISQKISQSFLFVWGVLFIVFPVAVATLTTDPFVLPKQILLGALTLLSFVALGAKMLLDGQVRIKRTPLDVPVLLFGTALLLSAIFSVNRADSLTSVVTVIFALLSYFAITNGVASKNAALFLVSSLLAGGVLATLVAILAHFKIYLLPFASTHVVTFNTFGSYFDLALYTAVLLPLVLHFCLPLLKQQVNARVGVFAVAGLVLIAGLILSVSVLFTTQKALLLPFDTGFQTAFAAISQDSGRLLQGFFFGSGFGNFTSVFTRFHGASLNANQQLWFLTFSNSSSFVLELLATTGLVGILAYLFLLFKSLLPIGKRYTNPFYLSLVLLALLSFLLPFSYVMIALFFFLLAGYQVYQKAHSPHEYFEIELKFVALKKGVLAFTTLDDGSNTRQNHPTAIIAFVALLVVVVVLGYYSVIYVYADTLFQSSLSSANANNGTVTYQLQSRAITTYPYRSAYYRIFSQTNIALANSLLSLQAGQNSSPSAQSQQTALTLVQQAITTARQATTLAPLSVIEWQNLSSVYRTLIGLGQNADQFAIQAAQQAVVLDPSNPQEYLTLGGLYYQLGQYDNAIRFFQQAITLKQDYGNAYYNLGHAYEAKGDLQNALAQYQIVKQLTANDKQNNDRITAEINALQAKIGSGGQQAAPTPTPSQQSGTQQSPLSLPPTAAPSQPVQGQIPLVSPTPVK
ncbi:MAG TPA: tetratricopeptide repeat protein [Candidatus Eisenbacteria bacterium]|nr:tetratricopeptide repeat protein [Candidatus Eisenbacteria bacterium]